MPVVARTAQNRHVIHFLAEQVTVGVRASVVNMQSSDGDSAQHARSTVVLESPLPDLLPPPRRKVSRVVAAAEMAVTQLQDGDGAQPGQKRADLIYGHWFHTSISARQGVRCNNCDRLAHICNRE